MRTPLASGLAAAALGLLLSGLALRSWQLVLLALPPIIVLALGSLFPPVRPRGGTRGCPGPPRRGRPPRRGTPAGGGGWRGGQLLRVWVNPLPARGGGAGFWGVAGGRGRARGPVE